jgi:hypothetical protein
MREGSIISDMSARSCSETATTWWKRATVLRSYRSIFAASTGKTARSTAFAGCSACLRQSADSTLCWKSTVGVRSSRGKLSEAARKSHTATSAPPPSSHARTRRATCGEVYFVTA